MRMRAWKWTVAATVALIAVAAWAFRTTPEVLVESAPVTSGAITRRVFATGTVQPVTAVDVGSQVSGTVQILGADFNSIVHQGQAIARLDPAIYEAALADAQAARRQAEAGLEQANADLNGLRTAEKNARTQLTRASALAAHDLVTDADLDAAKIAMSEASADVESGKAHVVQASAAVAQARAAVDQATVNLDHTVIRSPIEGIVMARNVDVGQTLAAAVQAPVLFRIAADLTRVQVQVDVDESDVAGLTAGEPASFEVESYPGVTFHGTVAQLRLQPVAEQTTTAATVATSTAAAASSTVATVVSYTAIIDVENGDERLRPGMTAEVALVGARRSDVVRIPNSALAFRPPPDVLRTLRDDDAFPTDAAGGGSETRPQYVWKFDGHRFTPVAVRIGLSDSNWTERLTGSIRPGDALVTTAVLRQRPRL